MPIVGLCGWWAWVGNIHTINADKLQTCAVSSSKRVPIRSLGRWEVSHTRHDDCTCRTLLCLVVGWRCPKYRMSNCTNLLHTWWSKNKLESSVNQNTHPNRSLPFNLRSTQGKHINSKVCSFRSLHTTKDFSNIEYWKNDDDDDDDVKGEMHFAETSTVPPLFPLCNASRLDRTNGSNHQCRRCNASISITYHTYYALDCDRTEYK